jgi:hypothetical protein
MYNEVFARCPKCGGRGYAQIHQIVLGFGGFALDDPESLAEALTVEQLRELCVAVKDLDFRCQNEDCGRSFQASTSEQEERKRVARELFGGGS